MANRDVNLIIRAKNQASKNLDSVSDALKALKGAQDGVASSASKTDGAISGLGQELDKLKTRSKAFEGLNKAKQYMTAAADAMGRLKSELGQTQAKLDAFAAESAAASARLLELDKAQAALVDRQKQQQAEMEAARKQTIKTSAAMKELAAAERAYAAAQKLKTDDPKRDKAITDAKARLDAAKVAVEQNKAAYASLNSTLDQTKEALSKVKQEIGAVKKTQRDLAKEVSSATSSFDNQKAAVAQAEAEYAQIETSVNEATAALGAFDTNTQDAAASSARLIPQIERLGAVMQALMRYSTGAGQFVDPKTAAKMQQLRTEADAAKASWQALEAEAKQLAAEMRALGGGTDQQKTQFRAIVGAAAAAKAEYQALTQQTHQLSGAGQTLAPMFSKVAVAADRTAKSQRTLKRDTEAAEAAIQKMNATASSPNGMIKLNHESRQAMSVFQRLRGEVLSLATAYVGLYGTIQNVGGVLTAYQKMEAAQNRLGVVFEQNQAKIGSELTWLQAQAARLGIEFGSLSDQYSKFAVAAQAANFSLADTRKVFLSVAEAGRVNKLSLEDMNGVFLALQQMISKGKISSEELRQQLGERLPGAMNIMADALGKPVDELYKMLEAGEILADSTTMLKFADELNRRFGPQLQKSLQSTSAQIGKFTNNLFQAQLQVANGGFIDAFNGMMEDLNVWFQSREGRDFFLSIGAGAGSVINGLRAMMPYMDDFLTAIKLIIGLKLGQFLFGIYQNFTQLSGALNGNAAATAALTVQQQANTVATTTLTARIAAARAGLLTFTAVMTTSTARALVLGRTMNVVGASIQAFSLRAAAAKVGTLAIAAGMGVLRGAVVALRVALAALGGPIGAIITIASLFAVPLITSWASEVDTVTAAMDEHQRIMQAVVTEYQNLTTATKDWAKEIDGITLDQVDNAILALRGSIQDLKQDLRNNESSIVDGISALFQNGDQMTTFSQVYNLKKQYLEGQKSTEEFAKALEELYATLDSNDTASREFLKTQLDIVRKIQEAEKAHAELSVTAKALGSTLEGVDETADASGKTIEQLGGQVEETGKQFGISKTKSEEFRKNLEEIAKLTPEIGKGLDEIKEKAKLDEAFKGAAKAAQTIGELSLAVRNYNEALSAMETKRIDNLIGGGLAGRIIGVESGGNASAKNPNSTATGLGQFIESTWLNLFKKYFPDTAAGMSNSAILELRKDAQISRQMVEFYLQENAEHLRKAGVAVTDANLYLAHFLGPEGARKLLTAAPNEPVANVLGGDQIAANKSILEGKTAADVIAWAQKKVGISERELAVAEEVSAALQKQREEAEKATQEKIKQNEETQKALADMGFENEMIQAKIDGKDKEAFIEEQIRGLKEQNANLTADQEAQARALLAKQFDLNKALDAEKDKKKGIEEIEQRIGDLESQRNSLIQQRDIYQEQGNTTKVQEVEGQIAAVNAQLTEAITKARAMYAAMGGTEADAAIAKLDTLGMEIGQANNSGQKFAYTAAQMAENIYNALDSGVLNMFDAFAQAIANGENAIGALGDAFRQFAADFLMEIAKMIIRQTMFNALQSFSKSLGGGLFSFLSLHSGGIAGQSTGSGGRAVSPAWFAGAARYHTGGIAGLKPNEVPAILQAGEEVLTQGDPRHSRNGGRSGGVSGGVRIINAFDPASFLGEALKNVIGEEAILNHVRANPAAFKQALEG